MNAMTGKTPMVRTLLGLLVLWLAGCTHYVAVGDRWRTAESLAQGPHSFASDLRFASSFRLGQTVSGSAWSALPARFWLLQVDGDDRLEFLVPNRSPLPALAPARTWTALPGADQDELEAARPLGPTLLVLIAHTGAVDLRASYERGGFAGVRQALDEGGAWSASRIVITVEP